MSEQSLKDFLKYYSIIFIIPGMRINSYRYGSFIKSFLDDSNLSYDIPKENNNSTLIIVPTKGKTFEELHHLKFINRGFNKIPRNIIVIIGIDNLTNIVNPFEWMKLLNNYRIPIIYSSIEDYQIEINIELVSFQDYDNSVIFNRNNESLHIIDYQEFRNRVIDLIYNSFEMKLKIYCYYSDELSKDEWRKELEEFNRIIDFYKRVNLSDGKILVLENNLLYIK